MGLYFIKALNDTDLYPIMAWLAITAVATILFNLLADIAYGFLDPRALRVSADHSRRTSSSRPPA